MKISYLINELEQLKEKHGDLEVGIRYFNEIQDAYVNDPIEDVLVTLDNYDNKKVASLL